MSGDVETTPREARGTVVEMHGVKATVLVDDSPEGERIRCRFARGGPRETPVVGDRVAFTVGRHGAELTEIAPRERTFVRPTQYRTLTVATHVDRLAIVLAVDPPPRQALIDRMVCVMEEPAIPVLIVLNKADLPGLDEARELLSHHVALGYDLVEVSAKTGAGLDALAARLADGMTVIIGHSGVGKSTLLNQIVPEAELRTGEVNEKTGKGRHTTTASHAYPIGNPWPSGGLLVDTPGIRSFPLHGVALLEVAARFPEHRGLPECYFGDCLHESEPGCVVRERLEQGMLAPSRHEDYLRLLAQVRTEQREVARPGRR